MGRVAVVHWKPDEAGPLMKKLRAGKVNATLLPYPPKVTKDDPPAAVVISLTRMPSYGRYLGFVMRQRQWSRHIPLVYVDGEPEKIARLRVDLPDATYTTTAKVAAAVKQVLRSPAGVVVVPGPYKGTSRTMAQKLCIGAGLRVAVINEPRNFRRAVGELPDDVELIEWPDRGTALTLWFVQTLDELREGISDVFARIGAKPLWVCWPKRSSGVKSDLTMNNIREVARRFERIDRRIASIDETWSGSLIGPRRGSR